MVQRFSKAKLKKFTKGRKIADHEEVICMAYCWINLNFLKTLDQEHCQLQETI